MTTTLYILLETKRLTPQMPPIWQKSRKGRCWINWKNWCTGSSWGRRKSYEVWKWW